MIEQPGKLLSLYRCGNNCQCKIAASSIVMSMLFGSIGIFLFYGCNRYLIDVCVYISTYSNMAIANMVAKHPLCHTTNGDTCRVPGLSRRLRVLKCCIRSYNIRTYMLLPHARIRALPYQERLLRCVDKALVD